MAKKGGGAALQLDCDNEEDWEKLVDRTGLIVCDIYSDWCGPCTGMSGNLKKIKLEIGGDSLTIATVKSDNIQCLERFRNKSEPTWMFISGGKMIRLLFGANAPRLISIVIEEIMNIKNNIPRDGIAFDELTEEEQQRVDEELRIKQEIEAKEKAAKEKAILKRRIENIKHLQEPLKDYIYIMLFPHVTNEQTARIFDATKELSLSVAGKPIKLTLTEENLSEMLCYQTWEMNKSTLDVMKTEEMTCLLFTRPQSEDSDVTLTDLMIQRVYGEMKGPPGDENSLSRILIKVIEIEKPQPEEQDDETKENNEDENEEEKPPEMIAINIPGILVPENDKVKVLAMRFLFPLITQKFDAPEAKPVPPHLILAFDAFKSNDILQLATEYPEETMHIGFFSSQDCETAQLIAKTLEEYEKILLPPYESKLILQISKEKSEPLLSYSLLGPSYISPDCVIGQEESKKFFPEGYDEPEPTVIQEPKKKSKKRARASKTSVVSETSAGSETKEEVEGEGEGEGEGECEGEEEEGTEELLEEEEEAEDENELEMGESQEAVDLIPPDESADKATSPLPE